MQLSKLWSLRDGLRRSIEKQLGKFDRQMPTREYETLLRIITSKAAEVTSLNDKIVNHAETEDPSTEIVESDDYSICLELRILNLRDAIPTEQDTNHNHSNKETNENIQTPANSVIHKNGFRSLADGEEVEFESVPSDKGVEATYVSGTSGSECLDSDRRPMSSRKIRCYNCEEFGDHKADNCPLGPLPKRCHNCKSTDHLIADCPLKDRNKRKDSRKGSGNSLDGASDYSSGGAAGYA